MSEINMDKPSENPIAAISDALCDIDNPESIKILENYSVSTDQSLSDIFRKLFYDSNPGLTLGIAKAIGMLKFDKCADLLIALAREPGKWFGREDRFAIQMAAIESLGILKEAKAVEALLELLHDSRDNEILLKAVYALGEIGSESAVLPLLSKMHAKPWVALSAAGALTRIGGEDAFNGLILSLKHEDEMVVSASIWALGEMGDPRAVGPLFDVGGKAEHLMRSDVVWALGRIGDPSALDALEKISMSDPDQGIRREAEKFIESRIDSRGTESSAQSE